MPHEFSAGNGVEQPMQSTQEALLEREPFFKETRLKGNVIICSDDRTEDGIHIFGGPASIAYNRTVMREALEPGSTTSTTFSQETSATVVQLEGIDVHSIIHSDMNCEGCLEFKADQPGDNLGCAYIAKRQAICQLVAEQGEDIISTVAAMDPSLFEGPEDYVWARQVIAATGRIAANSNFFEDSPRKVAMIAQKAGAKTTVFTGDHDKQSIGITNKQPNTTLDAPQARAAAKPAYNQDQWALDAINDESRSLYPFDKRQQQIAEAIDTEGVFRALSVEEKGVR